MAPAGLLDRPCCTARMALESYLSDLRMEIANTDSMDFRGVLKAKKLVLRAIANQLGADRGPDTA